MRARWPAARAAFLMAAVAGAVACGGAAAPTATSRPVAVVVATTQAPATRPSGTGPVGDGPAGPTAAGSPALGPVGASQAATTAANPGQPGAVSAYPGGVTAGGAGQSGEPASVPRPALSPPPGSAAAAGSGLATPTGSTSSGASAAGTALVALETVTAGRPPGPAQVTPTGVSPATAAAGASAARTTGPAGAAAKPVSAAPTAVAVSSPAAPTAPAAARPTPATGAPSVEGGFDPAAVSLRAERVGGQFIQPLFVTHAGDGSGRVFVVEKIGRIRLLDGAGFLDIAPKVLAPPLFSYEREQGLLGLAFHPRFRENGYLYVHYNNRQGNHVFARFTARGGGPADSASEKVILTVDQPQTNFNGGMVVFGRDGYLYLGLGTGGTDRALQQGAQDLGNLLGKILRIDVDGGDPYRVPPDNPFVGRAGARGEVWAYGLRNPYRFSFDRLTGDLYVGTPGEFRREWINFSPAGTGAGQNYGWPILEGTLCWQAASCDRTGLPVPIAEYDTYSGGSCAVIGGYVYRGARYPALRGAYLYGDFCSSQIWLAARGASGAWSSTPMLRLGGLISSFGEDEAGELYVVEIHGGGVHRLAAAAR